MKRWRHFSVHHHPRSSNLQSSRDLAIKHRENHLLVDYYKQPMMFMESVVIKAGYRPSVPVIAIMGYK
jgi:hypothetical protein